MKQSAEPATTASALRPLYAPIEAELAQFEEFLSGQLQSDFPFVDELAKYGFRLGGKRMRPALVLLSGRAIGRCTPDHVVLAAIVELIHTATLVHDDVLDEATIRRHLDTVNARWNNETSVLLGDYLFALALRLVASFDDHFAGRAIGEAARVVCEGELRQVASRGNLELQRQEYLAIIAAKTAALTACCCRLGAHYAGADAETVERLGRYGQHLGVAFQIADDLLDLLGDESTVGKSLGTDLVKQKLTLPLICLLERANAADRPKIAAALAGEGNHRGDTLRQWCQRYDTIESTRATAQDYIARACAELATLPESPARDALTGLAEFVLARDQ